MEIGQLQKFDEDEGNLGTKDYKRDIERVRRAKKNHFYANSGLIKLSTLHSYKGLESKTVFYLMGEDDDPEAVYTSITRSSENLIIFDIGANNECSGFMDEAVK